ncbi:MAG: fibronectin type III domain-containing protein [Bacteroidales bacterium]|nr:fibronectin type III domain-containing protein [Bacteroidales bacterium]
MKSFKILFAAAAVAAVLFSGCKKEIFTGIDSSKAVVTDFAYDETMSSETAISFVWNPTQALQDGATSFSVQLAQKEDFSDIDMYEPTVGKTIQHDATVNDGVIFTGLKEYTMYYARVRANYPRSIYSEWTELRDSDGLVCISVGHGIVTMSFVAPKVLTLSSPSYSKILASWSLVGKADGYEVSWKASKDSNWNILSETVKASEEINDLSAQTSYDVRVRAYRETDGNKEYTDYIQESITTPEKPPFEPNIKERDAFIQFVSAIAATSVASDVITLEADLDLGGAELPLSEGFAGKFDGKGHTISNAVIPDGLFGVLSGSIENLKLSGITLKNSLALTGTATSKIANVSLDNKCVLEFPEPAESANYGALAGYTEGTVEKCSSAATASFKFAALPGASCNWGGIVGYSKGVVSECSNSGKFSLSVEAPTKNTFHCFGGVVGMTEGEAGKSTVIKCTNTGEVSVEYGTAVYFYTGGVVGGTPSDKAAPGNYGVIENCTNEGNVHMHYINGGSGAYPNIGGVVGYTEGQLKGCVNKGNISILCDSASNTWTCTRLAGVGGTVTRGASDCHNYGHISVSALLAGGTAGNRGAGNIETSCFGGVIGAAGPYEPSNDVLFEKCTNEVDLELNIGTITETPNHHIGAVFGFVTGKIDNCQNKGNFTVTCPTAINRLGGIAGGSKCDVSNCTNTGDLKVVHPAITKNDWRHFIGGITADVNKAPSAPTYTKCVNSGNLTLESTATPATSKTSAIGGIVGCGKSGVEITFTDCSNTGKMNYTSSGNVVTGELRGGDYN